MISISENMFDKLKIDKIQEEFLNVKIDTVQNGMASMMAELLAKLIPLDQMVLKRFVLYSFRDWQKNSKKFLADMNKPGIALEEKFKVTEEINTILLDKLTNALSDSRFQDKLKEGIQKGNVMLKDFLKYQYAP